jgi:hypothetical protein
MEGSSYDPVDQPSHHSPAKQNTSLSTWDLMKLSVFYQHTQPLFSGSCPACSSKRLVPADQTTLCHVPEDCSTSFHCWLQCFASPVGIIYKMDQISICCHLAASGLQSTYSNQEIGVKHHTSRQSCTDWLYVTPIVSVSHLISGTVDDIPDRRSLACSDDTVPQWERAMTPLHAHTYTPRDRTYLLEGWDTSIAGVKMETYGVKWRHD